MTEFNYGDPIPAPLDRHKQKRDSERRLAMHYGKTYCDINLLLKNGGQDIQNGLHLWDLELGNLRHWHQWLQDAYAADRNDAGVVRMCRNFGVQAANTAHLRLSGSERVKWFGLAAEACGRLGDRPNKSKMLGNLGEAWASLGDLQKANLYFEQAASIARELGDPQLSALTLTALARGWALTKESQKAIDSYQRALELFRQHQDTANIIATLTNLANAWRDVGEFQKAIDGYEEALRLIHSTQRFLPEGPIYLYLGTTYLQTGDIDRAIENCERAVSLAQQIGDRTNYGAAATLLAFIFRSRGMVGEALSLAQAAHSALQATESSLADALSEAMPGFRSP